MKQQSRQTREILWGLRCMMWLWSWEREAERLHKYTEAASLGWGLR